MNYCVTDFRRTPVRLQICSLQFALCSTAFFALFSGLAIESYRYELNAPKSGSSHYTFRKPGAVPITIPKHEPIKKVYVEMVRQVIESEEKKHEDVE